MNLNDSVGIIPASELVRSAADKPQVGVEAASHHLQKAMNNDLPNPSADEEVETPMTDHEQRAYRHTDESRPVKASFARQLERELTQLRQQHNAEREEWKAESMRLLKETEQLTVSLSIREAELATAQKTIEALKARENDWEKTAEDLNNQLHALRSQLQTAMEERDAAIRNRDEWRNAATESKQAYGAANSRLEEARTGIENLKAHDIDSQTRHMLNVLLSRLSTSRETENKT